MADGNVTISHALASDAIQALRKKDVKDAYLYPSEVEAAIRHAADRRGITVSDRLLNRVSSKVYGALLYKLAEQKLTRG